MYASYVYALYVCTQAKTLLETPKVSARTHVLKADKMRALGNIKSKVVKGNQKSLFDYNLDSEAEEGEEVWHSMYDDVT